MSAKLQIVQAAVQHRGCVHVGRRHGLIMLVIHRMYPNELIRQDQQGFLVSDGRFVNRREAGVIAFAAGQTMRLKEELTSEDIW